MFADPQKIIEVSGIREGMQVADIGAGSGAYTIAAAQKVGPSGKVFAIDIQKDLLAHIKGEAGQKGLTNIEYLVGDVETLGGTKLRDRTIEYALVSNTLFQIEDKTNFLREMFRILRPGGFVLLIEWAGSFGNIGPAAEVVIEHEDARLMFEHVGFQYLKNLSAGSYHYALLFKKP